MADLDAELLALAGDDSGDESVASPAREKSSSPVYEKEDTPPARKSSSRTSRKPRRRNDYSDDDQDDMSESAASVSASMSQSDSEAEFEADDDKPIFAYERLYHNAKDKAEIEAKPEIEREAILAERNEQIEKHEQNAQLRRMLHARQKEEMKQSSKKKRKASAADLDETQRKSSRQRTKVGGGRAGEADSGIAAYKKKREEQALLKEQRKSGVPPPRRDPLVDDYSDADAEGQSEDEYDYERARDHRRDNRRKERHRRSPSPLKDDPPAEITDIQRVRIGRENFAQVCYTPGFEETIKGCYARVCLGPGRNPGQNEYRLCSIKGFQEGRPYAIEGPNRKQILVNKYIVAVHGKAEKPWSFLECSNSKFTDDEWRRYRTTMANDDCRMPTKGQINTKLAQINKLIAHRFTDAEISMKLKQQNDLLDQVNRTSEKRALKSQITDAEERGDDETVKDLEDQLLNLVHLKLALGTLLHTAAPAPAKVTHETDRLAKLNSHNQRQASESMQKAAMLKRRQYKKLQQSQDSTKLAVPTPNASQTKSLDDDLFGSASDISRTGTPVNGAGGSRAGTPARSTLGNGISRSGTPLSVRGNNGGAGAEKKGLPMIKKTRRDDEVLAEMDLGIDIEI